MRVTSDIEKERQKVKQERMAVAVQQAELEDKLANAAGVAAEQKEEVTRLRARLDQHFKTSKQELEAALAEQRRLRQLLPPSGTAGTGSDGAARPPPAEASTAGSTSAAAAAATLPHVDTPTPSAGLEVAAWASELLTNLSQDGRAAGVPDVRCPACAVPYYQPDALLPCAAQGAPSQDVHAR
jgi:hypothetical protein